MVYAVDYTQRYNIPIRELTLRISIMINVFPALIVRLHRVQEPFYRVESKYTTKHLNILKFKRKCFTHSLLLAE